MDHKEESRTRIRDLVDKWADDEFYSVLLSLQIGKNITANFFKHAAGKMDIYVQTTNGETITLEVGPSDFVTDVKQKIEDEIGYPVDQQRLFWGGDILRNDTLSSYEIEPKSTLSVSLMQMGGMYHPSSGRRDGGYLDEVAQEDPPTCTIVLHSLDGKALQTLHEIPRNTPVKTIQAILQPVVDLHLKKRQRLAVNSTSAAATGTGGASAKRRRYE
mmetsp:Transcript_9514/g.15687  ORF Transcript_9514/g.15687 Transcript_9514/m.15687 type:complete len:216 (+) Transcript_9514:860-1507(+)